MVLKSSRSGRMLAVDSLDAADRDELEKLRQERGAAEFERQLFLWAIEVNDLENEQGYSGCPDDFCLGLRRRDGIEAYIAHASPALALKLRAAVAPFDERFRAATRPDTDGDHSATPYEVHGAPPYPDFPGWWWSRSPIKIDRRSPRERIRDRTKRGGG